MLVQVTQKCRIELAGNTRTYPPGTWLEIGRQAAEKLAKEKKVWIPEPVELEEGCGLVTSKRVRAFKGEVTVLRKGERPRLPYERTIVWDGSKPLHQGRMRAGLGMLEKWEVVVPVASYDRLARDIGNETDRARTEAVIHDLRVPFFHTGFMFVRKTATTEALFAKWQKEEGDERLAFLRVLYQTQPLVLHLPASWMEG